MNSLLSQSLIVFALSSFKINANGGDMVMKGLRASNLSCYHPKLMRTILLISAVILDRYYITIPKWQ